MKSLFKTVITVFHSTGDWDNAFYHVAGTFGEAKQQANDKFAENPGVKIKSTKFVVTLDKLEGGKFVEVSRKETPNTTP